MPHALSLYAATADPNLAFPVLGERVQAHVAIIGGGYTGLSAALHLAEAGVDIVLIESERVGWGASGRNGGQVHSGQRRDQDWLEERLGREDAHHLWRLAEEAKALVKDLIARHAIDCGWRAGLIEAVHRGRLVRHEFAYVEKLQRDYGYGAVEWLDREAVAAAIGTGVYFGGRRDAEAGHLDPLKFARGLARAAGAPRPLRRASLPALSRRQASSPAGPRRRHVVVRALRPAVAKARSSRPRRACAASDMRHSQSLTSGSDPCRLLYYLYFHYHEINHTFD